MGWNSFFVVANFIFKAYSKRTLFFKIKFLIKFNKTNETLELINKSIAKHPDNINLWTFNLKLKIDLTNQDNEEKLFECFYDAIKSVQLKVTFKN